MPADLQLGYKIIWGFCLFDRYVLFFLGIISRWCIATAFLLWMTRTAFRMAPKSPSSASKASWARRSLGRLSARMAIGSEGRSIAVRLQSTLSTISLVFV